MNTFFMWREVSCSQRACWSRLCFPKMTLTITPILHTSLSYHLATPLQRGVQLPFTWFWVLLRNLWVTKVVKMALCASWDKVKRRISALFFKVLFLSYFPLRTQLLYSKKLKTTYRKQNSKNLHVQPVDMNRGVGRGAGWRGIKGNKNIGTTVIA